MASSGDARPERRRQHQEGATRQVLEKRDFARRRDQRLLAHQDDVPRIEDRRHQDGRDPVEVALAGRPVRARDDEDEHARDAQHRGDDAVPADCLAKQYDRQIERDDRRDER